LFAFGTNLCKRKKTTAQTHTHTPSHRHTDSRACSLFGSEKHTAPKKHRLSDPPSDPPSTLIRVIRGDLPTPSDPPPLWRFTFFTLAQQNNIRRERNCFSTHVYMSCHDCFSNRFPRPLRGFSLSFLAFRDRPRDDPDPLSDPLWRLRFCSRAGRRVRVRVVDDPFIGQGGVRRRRRGRWGRRRRVGPARPRVCIHRGGHEIGTLINAASQRRRRRETKRNETKRNETHEPGQGGRLYLGRFS
jgi:hypothetical protein